MAGNKVDMNAPMTASEREQAIESYATVIANIAAQFHPVLEGTVMQMEEAADKIGIALQALGFAIQSHKYLMIQNAMRAGMDASRVDKTAAFCLSAGVEMCRYFAKQSGVEPTAQINEQLIVGAIQLNERVREARTKEANGKIVMATH